MTVTATRPAAPSEPGLPPTGAGHGLRSPVMRAADLGSASFRRDHGVRLAYVAGAMYKGVASAEMVERMGRSRLLAYYGSGGIRSQVLDGVLSRLGRSLGADLPWGCNLLAAPDHPQGEDEVVDLLLAHRVRRVEAASFVQMSPALVRYRLTGAWLDGGRPVVPNRVLGKASRPEVAEAFLAPPPAHVVATLVEQGRLGTAEAEVAPHVTMADDLCAEADSGGHTDQRPLAVLLPDMVRLRDRLTPPGGPYAPVRVGAAGGIGTPEAVVAAFVLGADFVLTGSINQCTVEAGTSDAAKDMLAEASVQDTAIVPAGDMLELGARAQVLRRGLFFPARANKLYELYRTCDAIEDIDERTAQQIQSRYFRRSFAEVWDETRAYLARTRPDELAEAERDPKRKLGHVVRWYFVHATRLAMSGSADQRVDYQIPCGPAMGALNGYLRGTRLESWRARHVDELADLLLDGAAQVLTRRLGELLAATASTSSNPVDARSHG
jgi:trans-AT polyketide synthase/acyltransferase/oxidoreductase domain-containing protein